MTEDPLIALPAAVRMNLLSPSRISAAYLTLEERYNDLPLWGSGRIDPWHHEVPDTPWPASPVSKVASKLSRQESVEMRRSALVLFFIIFPAWARAQTVALPKVTPWPQNRVAAVSLTFDDALPTQLDVAAPILKKHHLHGTFFVVTGAKTWTGRSADWCRLAAEGNEIGSHTVHHPCLLDGFKPNARDYTAEMMRAELRDSAHAIASQLGTRRGLTLAYPCCNMTFGPPAEQARNQAAYLAMAAEYYFAARGDNAGMPVNPPELNPLTINGLSRTVGVDAPALIAMLPPIFPGNQWGVFTFHGIGGDNLSTTAEALDRLAGHLEQHPEIWCATMGDAVRYILERKALEIEVERAEVGRMQFKLRWPLDARVFDLPLTLRWQAPGEWKAFECRADGRTLKYASGGGTNEVLVDVPPQTKELRFEAK